MQERRRVVTSVVAHIDHGKTSLIDSLVAARGRLSKSLAGSARFLDTREDEQSRGITLKLSAITIEHGDTDYIIIDTPGHVDFEPLIQASSVLSDNFLVLVDINEGITPRTYTLVNYVKGKGCVLAVNKIDKISSEEEMLERTQCAVSSMNALIGEELFSWESGNVILCCAMLCYGINSKLYRKRTNKEGALRAAIRFIFHLQRRIKDGQVDQLCEKFGIRIKNMKNILSTVLPLSECLFDSMASSYRIEDGSLERPNQSGASKEDAGKVEGVLRPLLQSNLATFSRIAADGHDTPVEELAPSILAITSHGLLRSPCSYSRDMVLFVTRIFFGSMKKGDRLYSVGSSRVEECTVEEIYTFGVNEFIETDEATGPILVCLRGDLQKNSIITDRPTHWMDIRTKMMPFYRSKLVLDDPQQADRLKEVFRAMSFTEQCLKVRLNKYQEFEMLCSGKVHFEKIMVDLHGLGFIFSVIEAEEQFCEYASGSHSETFSYGGITLKVAVSKAADVEDDGRFSMWEDSARNVFLVGKSSFSDVVESVLEVFTTRGPLIRERIMETQFLIEAEGELAEERPDTLYSFIKSSLSSVYSKSSPAIAPLFYECRISVQGDFLGQIYKCLSKYNYVMGDEEYDQLTGFYTVRVLVPQFLYSEFVEDARIRTRGTAYLVFKEAGFVSGYDFSSHVSELRKRKGLFVEEKIVEKPSKQRMHRR
jgi:elongation factor 2